MRKLFQNGVSIVSMSRKAKWIRMVVLGLGYIGTGTSFGIPGPSLIDLEIRTSSATKDIALMFLLRACGALIGSLISGYIFDTINADVILAVVEAAAGAVIIAAPWWQHLLGVSICLGFSGLFNAIVNIGVLTYCVSMWGPANPPYLMLLAFLNSGISSAAIPLVRSLLLPRSPTSHTNIREWNTTISNLTHPEQHINQSSTWNIRELGLGNTTVKHAFSPHDVKVQYAFLLPGACFIAACIGHLLLSASQSCSLAPLFKRNKASTKDSSGDKGQGETSKKMAKWKGIILLVTFGILAANIGALSESYITYLFSFLVRHLHWTKMNAAWPLLAVGTCNYIAQIIFIVIAKFLKSSLVMGILQTAMLVSNIIMCLPIAAQLPVFWTSIILCGLALGPVGPTVVSWMSKIFGPSGRITSFFFSVGYMSRMVNGYLMGYLFDTHGPIWFVYMNIITVGVSTVAYGLTVFLTDGGPRGQDTKHGHAQEEDPAEVPMVDVNYSGQSEENRNV